MGVRRSVHESSEDPQHLLVQLVASCRAVGRDLERVAFDDGAASAVRRCAIELSLLLEACGVPAREVSTAPAGRDVADLVASYRRALRSPLPRAVQAVLRDQLARLERTPVGGPLRAAAPGRLPADRSLAA